MKKRTTGKAYGLIFNCLATRAVHVDISPDYSTEKFLMVLRRFVSIRGYPSKLYSDNRARLVSANEELKRVIKDLDPQSLKQFGVTQGLQTFSELQTVCFEAANLVNERPIGRHPTSPHDESYLCPSDLLLGHSTS